MKQIRQAAMRSMAEHLKNLAEWEPHPLYFACYLSWLKQICADAQNDQEESR